MTLKHVAHAAACSLALTRIESIKGTLPDSMPFAVGDRGIACFKDWVDRPGTPPW